MPAGRSGVRERPCAPSNSAGGSLPADSLPVAFLQHDLSSDRRVGKSGHPCQESADGQGTNPDEDQRTGNRVVISKGNDHRARETESPSNPSTSPGTKTSAASNRKPTMIRTTIASNGPTARQARKSSPCGSLLVIVVFGANCPFAGKKFLDGPDSPKRRILHAVGDSTKRAAHPA